jgi:hypothetical protein
MENGGSMMAGKTNLNQRSDLFFGLYRFVFLPLRG